jgi:hypothetical protein
VRRLLSLSPQCEVIHPGLLETHERINRALIETQQAFETCSIRHAILANPSNRRRCA